MGQPVKPKVELVWSTPDPRRIIAVAARMCYSAKPVSELLKDLQEEEIDKMVNHILTVRHYSVLRHVLFMFTIEGVSRSFSHQFVRHHVGFDVEQRSQHYRREKDFDFNLPASIPTGGPEDAYFEHMEKSQQLYDDLISVGVDKSEARQVLPNACETQMVVTLNLNSAINVLSQRACRLNTPEILQVAIQVRSIICKQIKEAWRFLGPTCWTQGICYEGEAKYMKACRRPWQSPTVLWNKDFPSTAVLVGMKDGKHYRNEVTHEVNTRVEPDLKYQEAQGEDGKNQS